MGIDGAAGGVLDGRGTDGIGFVLVMDKQRP